MANPTPNTQSGSLFNTERGSNDKLTGSFLFGNAQNMFDASEGGKDKLIGGANAAFNDLYGDAGWMYATTALAATMR